MRETVSAMFVPGGRTLCFCARSFARKARVAAVNSKRFQSVSASTFRRCSTKASLTQDRSTNSNIANVADVDSDEASNGWLYGYALDGEGGGRKLKPWDEEVIQNLQAQQRANAGETETSEELVGYWVHLDFVHAKNVAWLWHVVQASGVSAKTNDVEDMGDLWLSRLAEQQIVSLPRCEISADSDALFLSFRAALAPRAGVDVVELRVCLTRHLLLTARVQELPEGMQLLPEIDQQLREGRGGKTCGEVTAAIVAGATLKSSAAAQEAFERVLGLRARFQGRALAYGGARPVARKELAFLSQHLSLIRYDSTKLLRYLTLQRDALNSILALSTKRKQNIFSRADSQRFRQAVERQEAQIETLNNVGDSAEVLHGELMTHVNWGTADGTYRLTVFGGFAYVLIIVNICASLFEFSERRGFLPHSSVVQPRQESSETSVGTQTD